MVQIEHFLLNAVQHPEDAAPDRAVWKVTIRVKFKSDDPADWGEFRAYGASWTRKLNRTHKSRNIMVDSPPIADPSLRSRPRREEITSQLETDSTLPFWAVSGPSRQDELKWRMAIDQHMEIYYAKIVPGIPRSDPDSDLKLPDDDNSPDDPENPTCCDRADLAGLGTQWHIIAVDMPEHSPMQIGDYLEYWHRGEFRIREPKTGMLCPQRKQLFCRVSGLYPDFVYNAMIDSVVDENPASFEGSIWSTDDPNVIHYPDRNLTIRK